MLFFLLIYCKISERNTCVNFTIECIKMQIKGTYTPCIFVWLANACKYRLTQIFFVIPVITPQVAVFKLCFNIDSSHHILVNGTYSLKTSTPNLCLRFSRYTCSSCLELTGTHFMWIKVFRFEVIRQFTSIRNGID